MLKDLNAIEEELKGILRGTSPALEVKKDAPQGFEVGGTIAVMQGKQKVDGHYFASVIAKPKDIRFYFFPIYTHTQAFDLSPELKKFLKGKSCFHIKSLTPEITAEISSIVETGVNLYKQDGLI